MGGDQELIKTAVYGALSTGKNCKERAEYTKRFLGAEGAPQQQRRDPGDESEGDN